MSTLRQRILDLITTEYPHTLTNQQIATRLDANEPSVRRAVKEFENAGEVVAYAGGYSNLPIEWQRSAARMNPAPATI